MTVLDDLDAIAKQDPTDFLGTVEKFPQQLTDAFEIAAGVDKLPKVKARDIRSVAILGMGGSGISGDVLRSALATRTSLYVDIVKGYELPSWVGEDTLVFAASYSGKTEETLATVEQARKRGSKLVCVSTGGTLADIAESAGSTFVPIPSGLQPRAALGYLSVPLLVICERLGLAQGLSDAIQEAIELATKRSAEYSRASTVDSNAAKKLATELSGFVPIIYGSEGFTSVAAYRWKCQFNESSKVPAYHHVFPELNHNEVVGWDQLDGLTTRSFALVVLRHDGESPRIAKRVEITLELVQEHFGVVQEVIASGTSDVAQLFDLTYLGDFASTYLAIAHGVDPAPVDVLQQLKDRLAESR